MSDISKKYVDYSGNIWYMGAWYVPFKFIKFGWEGIYDADYDKFPKSRYLADISKYPLNCGPSLGVTFWAAVKAISYLESKFDYSVKYPDNYQEMLGYLEWGMYQLKKEKKSMELKGNSEQAIADGVLGEYQDLLLRMDKLIQSVEHVLA